jgi:UDP-N-acetylmuramate dehydrogenase
LLTEEDISLKEFSTLRVGGKADFFTRAKNIEELKEALSFAQQKKLPTFIFGGGSNLLFSDEGFRGLVIKNEIQNVEFTKNVVRVGSGALLAALVMESARRCLAGLENFAGIPGTVGGAVVGNANEIGEKVAHVKILSAEGEEITVARDDLEFSYRGSNLRGKIIAEVEFTLEKATSDLQTKVAEAAREKTMKHPYEGTAGSWFRNPSFVRCGGLRRTSPGDKKAWELIEKAGCRNLSVGDAVISEQHANFFQNAGEATAADFLELEKQVVKKVEQKFGVKLEREVVVLEKS